jgi:hypothetical protein
VTVVLLPAFAGAVGRASVHPGVELSHAMTRGPVRELLVRQRNGDGTTGAAVAKGSGDPPGRRSIGPRRRVGGAWMPAGRDGSTGAAVARRPRLEAEAAQAASLRARPALPSRPSRA